MRTTRRERQAMLLNRLHDMGFSYEEIWQLRRIQMTLRRWAELECGDSDNYKSWAIERDEATDKPRMVIHPHWEKGAKPHSYAVPDREKGALKRLAAIMAKHDGYVAYHQSDPRGCALYIVPKADLNGCPIDQAYTRGLAVCD